LAASLWLRCDELIGEALMIPLGIIMAQVLVDCIQQGAFA